MVTDLFQASNLERSWKQKARFGSVPLTLFLAGWLNLLVQPCLMAAPIAAPINDCREVAVQRQTVLPSGSTANLPDHGVIEFSFLVDCESMEDCADWVGANPAIPSFEPEKKFPTSTVSSAQIQPGPVSFSLPPNNQNPVFSRVPLFIQNCAFLI